MSARTERPAAAAAEAPPRGPADAAPPGPRTLDDLARLRPRDLHLLYSGARVPRVEDLEGRLVGRMLAVPAAASLPIVPAALRSFAASSVFPWQGKTFRTLAPGRGEGKNRVIGNRFEWFRFTTAAGPSRAGDFDAVHLDYDHRENPAAIRAIKDEVREVAPGLWLGLAYVEAFGRRTLALFFGLARAG